LNYQNNYVERSNQLLEYQNFLQRCSLFSRVQQNYFDDSTKLLLHLYPKILDLSAKSFFPCMYTHLNLLKLLIRRHIIIIFNDIFECFYDLPSLSIILLLEHHYINGSILWIVLIVLVWNLASTHCDRYSALNLLYRYWYLLSSSGIVIVISLACIDIICSANMPSRNVIANISCVFCVCAVKKFFTQWYISNAVRTD